MEENENNIENMEDSILEDNDMNEATAFDDESAACADNDIEQDEISDDELSEEEIDEIFEENDKKNKKEKKYLIKNKIVREIVSWTCTILVALFLAIFINTYVIRISNVDGDSMLQTYHSGETVYISRLPYIFGDIERNDIVVFDSTREHRTFFTEIKEAFKYNVISYNLFGVEQPKKYHIKRIIAIEGDTIKVNEEGVFVNGKLLDEPYVNPNFEPNYSGVSDELKEGVVVPKDCVFVMGDNRNQSRDSRRDGFVPEDSIIGKVNGT